MVVEGWRFAVRPVTKRPVIADRCTVLVVRVPTASVVVVRGLLLTVAPFTNRPVDALLLTLRAIRHLNISGLSQMVNTAVETL